MEQGGIVSFEPVVERWALQACFSSGKRCAVRNARVRGDFANRYVNTKVFHVARGQGYQLGFQSGPRGLPTWGRDILLVPRDEGVTTGVVVHLRQTKAGSFTKHDQGFLGHVRKAFWSFNFGTDRAKW